MGSRSLPYILIQDLSQSGIDGGSPTNNPLYASNHGNRCIPVISRIASNKNKTNREPKINCSAPFNFSVPKNITSVKIPPHDKVKQSCTVIIPSVRPTSQLSAWQAELLHDNQKSPYDVNAVVTKVLAFFHILMITQRWSVQYHHKRYHA